MSFRSVIVVVAGLLLAACGPTKHARMVPFEKRELRCMQQYRNGDIQEAKQALLDHFSLVEEEETSGLPFAKTGYTKALIAARLALVYQQLGETNLANQELSTCVADARKDAQQEGNRSLLEKTDAQVLFLMTNAVNQLDENTRPKWRLASAR